jgi:hypothetical protein
MLKKSVALLEDVVVIEVEDVVVIEVEAAVVIECEASSIVTFALKEIEMRMKYNNSTLTLLSLMMMYHYILVFEYKKEFYCNF